MRTWKYATALAVASSFVLAGCMTQAPSPPRGLNPFPTVTPTEVITVTSECFIKDGKADKRCTPGSTNKDVTQANINETICSPPPCSGCDGWTDGVRPSTSYTNRLKARQLLQYGETGPLSAYKEDHLIALVLGGEPDDPLNLWPQPNAPSYVKDRRSKQLRKDVCAGRISLVDAQTTIVREWTH